MSITLFGPIEIQMKKKSVVTGVPSGKTNKYMLFDLHPHFIRGGDDESNSSGPSNDDDDEEDTGTGGEDFIDAFTLSRFQKDLMMLASDQFPEECDIRKNSLGRKCKMLLQKQWNSSAWTETPTTDMFYRKLREQTTTKPRIKNGCLRVRF